MRRHMQAGFTLIELIITIVTIGILAAVAVVKYQNLTAAAGDAAVKSVAAAAASASVTNYALRVGGLGGQALATCSDSLALADRGAFVVTSTADPLHTDGTSVTCTFTSASPAGNATASIYGAL